jgi:hypothetical protein
VSLISLLCLVLLPSAVTDGQALVNPVTQMSPRHGAVLLSVAGSYPTKATLVPGLNTCGEVTVQDGMTTVAHEPGAHALAVTHSGNTYHGTVDDQGAFATSPRVLSSGASEFTLSITGQFQEKGLTASVRIDVKQPGPPPACPYTVRWVAIKQGPPNTIPK